MREIKFRVFDRTNKCFKYAVFDNGGWDFGESKFIQPDTEWMQYTGLKDKNGKEIYEGDIVRGNSGAEVFIFEVDFENGCFIAKVPWLNKDEEFKHASYPELKFYVGMTFVSIEVIGNIYDNPELLT